MDLLHHSSSCVYSGVGAKKVPENVVLRTIIVHGSFSADGIKREVLRT